MGGLTETALEEILNRSSVIRDPGERTAFISRYFLGVDYLKDTLIGSSTTEERLVVNLRGVDCFTFIDYVEALRLSESSGDFREKLKRVRYRSGKVAYENRNHFFTDWINNNSSFVEDVTEKIGGDRTLRAMKTLNIREDGSYILSGIKPRKREIMYIPSGSVDDGIFGGLKTGDYAGIYTDVGGLDVSHVGIVIVREDNISFRHASSESRYMRVVDQDLKLYISGKPGLVILRPRDPDRHTLEGG